MAKKLPVLVVTLAVLASGAYFGGEYLLRRSAEAVLAKLEASLPQGATLTHGDLQTNLLRREVVLKGFDIKAPEPTGARTLSATNLRLAGLPWVSRGAFELGELVVEGLRVEHSDVITAERWSIQRPGVQILNQLASLEQLGSAISFAQAEAVNLTVIRSHPKLEVKVASISSGALIERRLASVQMRGVVATSQDNTGPLVRMTIDEVAGADVDLGLLITPDGNFSLTAPLLSNSVGSLSVSKLSLGPENGEPLTVNRIDVTGEGQPDGTRTHATLKVDQAVIPLDAMPAPSRDYYGALGYPEIALSLDMSGAYDPAAHTARLESFNLVAQDAATVNLQLGISGLPATKDMAAASAESAQMALSSISLSSFKLVVMDTGMVKRHVAYGARQLAVEPEVYVEQAINRLRPPGGSTGPGAQKLAQLYRAVSSFLLTPGELTIEANPEKPVSFLQLVFSLNNLPGAAENLNISAANRQVTQNSPAP